MRRLDLARPAPRAPGGSATSRLRGANAVRDAEHDAPTACERFIVGKAGSVGSRRQARGARELLLGQAAALGAEDEGRRRAGPASARKPGSSASSSRRAAPAAAQRGGRDDDRERRRPPRRGPGTASIASEQVGGPDGQPGASPRRARTAGLDDRRCGRRRSSWRPAPPSRDSKRCGAARGRSSRGASVVKRRTVYNAGGRQAGIPGGLRDRGPYNLWVKRILSPPAPASRPPIAAGRRSPAPADPADASPTARAPST